MEGRGSPLREENNNESRVQVTENYKVCITTTQSSTASYVPLAPQQTGYDAVRYRQSFGWVILQASGGLHG